MKRTFELNGKSYNTMMEMARELGVKRIYPKDFDKYGIKEVSDADVADTTVDTTVDTLQDYANSLKKKTVDELVKLCNDAGVDTCDSISFEPIRKMHLVMNLKAKMFPGEKLETRKPTAFRKIPFDTLKTTADDMKLEYRKSDNEAITRMWITKALVDAGVNPEDLVKKAGDDQ